MTSIHPDPMLWDGGGPGQPGRRADRTDQAGPSDDAMSAPRRRCVTGGALTSNDRVVARIVLCMIATELSSTAVHLPGVVGSPGGHADQGGRNGPDRTEKISAGLRSQCPQRRSSSPRCTGRRLLTRMSMSPNRSTALEAGPARRRGHPPGTNKPFAACLERLHAHPVLDPRAWRPLASTPSQSHQRRHLLQDLCAGAQSQDSPRTMMAGPPAEVRG
jgi:hypothetical protein